VTVRSSGARALGIPFDGVLVPLGHGGPAAGLPVRPDRRLQRILAGVEAAQVDVELAVGKAVRDAMGHVHFPTGEGAGPHSG
jgi:hypothetical protein